MKFLAYFEADSLIILSYSKKKTMTFSKKEYFVFRMSIQKKLDLCYIL